ncbi:carnitine O-palmitoyltransferase 1, liver isoform-like [Argiope bruennichi]|uniref:carnitine O-palmitoyltransferase 1, liver isoform-like n=1 Tax=Argiope bruennichi TaxID=94029 RepID=UPI0024949086|nr:carnitine O-palmitoyltransferase 1, liver isoform-like [Argiope bruennichi]XP_055939232.1 carnitine O-palmitoyltransferase 1, liver isoform-like [Argiope bruennichi]XP_055939233.1 carnitine O-palmitoyltransferase 1, liver isoform-like [Argiope bruennichi]XP_055939235.1 carnitine O-palmitoyltransferase 1, liver isoform-like [Argiope bruennichi]
MAEAHVAVAFSFAITHEGVNINYDREVLNLVWNSGLRSWKKRIARFMNNIHSGIYPASLSSLFILIALVTSLFMANVDVSFGGIHQLEHYIPGESLAPFTVQLAACVAYSFCLWVTTILFLRYTLKLLLMYKGWMYEGRLRKTSLKTYIWAALVRTLTAKRRPMLYSFQSSLPRLPLPSLEETMERYLCTVRPLLNDERYEKMKQMTYEFQNGVGKKLQLYLWLKSWWSSNYVTDWWEDYVYLSGRAPLLVYSNCYGLDYMPLPTTNQVARAANFIYAALTFRKLLNTQTLKPVTIQNFIPLCAWQYERMFNTTRVPDVEKDRVVHLSDSQHIAVYHRGRYYKVMLYNNRRLLKPVELQWQLQQILDDTSVPAPGEHHLAALTANHRTVWANARTTYFNKGLNKASLKAIEDAAFFLVLYDEELDFDANDPSKLNKFSQAVLHGKGYNLWLDKSFNIVVSKNGRLGCNCEHSWCDSPIMSHFWEFCIGMEVTQLKYTEDGNTVGELEDLPPVPSRLKWDLHPECLDLVRSSTLIASDIIAEVDLQVLYHSDYGKNFIKKCKVSPDAFVQMVLQLAYYRDAGCFNLTYEAAMMRLFREGRTETVRPVTMESCDFVLSVDNPDLPAKEKLALLQRACQKHQESYINAMCGKGVDRHIFCLYVLSKHLDVKSPFLKEVLGEPWRLSTSQTPHNQAGILDTKKFPEYVCLGGGFGPVANDGYGVSYDIASEDVMFFHISSKRTSPETDTSRFIGLLEKSLQDVKQIFFDSQS